MSAPVDFTAIIEALDERIRALESENHALRLTCERLEGSAEDLDSKVRDLQSAEWRIRQDFERLSGDVVYLEGAIR